MKLKYNEKIDWIIAHDGTQGEKAYMLECLRYGRRPTMKLKNAKLCLDCEHIFTKGQKCPACSSTVWTYLSRWLPSIITPDIPYTPAPVNPLPFYMRWPLLKSLFNPFPPVAY